MTPIDDLELDIEHDFDIDILFDFLLNAKKNNCTHLEICGGTDYDGIPNELEICAYFTVEETDESLAKRKAMLDKEAKERERKRRANWEAEYKRLGKLLGKK